MCKVLKISRSTYYAYQERTTKKDPLSSLVVKIFNENQQVYGTRKLKVELAKRQHSISRRRISRIMRINGLVSAYTAKKYRASKDATNNEVNSNIVGRQFNGKRDAFATVKTNLNNFSVFHTDRGSEFKNYMIDDVLKEFNICRSLSSKGCPYDNAVAEAQFKIIKTEFVRLRRFQNLNHLKTELKAYVYWFNNKRIHGTLGYKSPVEFRLSLL